MPVGIDHRKKMSGLMSKCVQYFVLSTALEGMRPVTLNSQDQSPNPWTQIPGQGYPTYNPSSTHFMKTLPFICRHPP